MAKTKAPARKKAAPIDGTAQVNGFMRELDHEFKDVIEAVRSIIMKANSKMQERVKWNAPSFYYREDMAAFNLRAKGHAHLVMIFPKGLIDDESGLLQGDYKDRRMAYFTDMKDVKAKKAALEKVVNAWVEMIDKQ